MRLKLQLRLIRTDNTETQTQDDDNMLVVLTRVTTTEELTRISHMYKHSELGV